MAWEVGKLPHDYNAPRRTANSDANPIARARLAKGMTQGELAQEIGVSQQQLGQWEKGGRKPKVDALIRIADALGIDFRELFEI